MKNLYVILSATPTIMGKIVRIITRSAFNHSSISLSENWDEMYSFARHRACNPLVGGFVKEFPQRLSLGKDRNVYIKVYKIPIDENQFNEIKLFIYNIRDDDENIYDTMAALGIFLRCKFDTYKAYTCSDFVAKSLLMGNVILENQTSKDIIPDEIEKLLDKYTFFTGSLCNYTPVNGASFDTKDFFEKTNFIKEMARTFHHFYSLFKRNNKAC
ncbi:MAG TPA: hypothetical protein VIK78_04540 [Ruminiclostridium sp.]